MGQEEPGNTNFARLNSLIQYLPPGHREFIHRAHGFAEQAHEGQRRQSGGPYFKHVFEVACLLAELRLDQEAVSAGLLHDVVEDTPVTSQQLLAEFGDSVAAIVEGVTKIGKVHFHSPEQRQAENFRKMLLSMVADGRIIFVKLADRLHNMRTLNHLETPKQNRIAQETLDIYAPLAHRMGINHLKWQLEDLSFKYLHPEDFGEIVKHIGLKREEREAYLERISEPIRNRLVEAGIEAEVSGRAKHLYSIFKKMKQRHKRIDELYDLLALRIIVHNVRDCYHSLGILHTLYTPIHERFKDYIATPKINQYRSLHTTLVPPEGHFLEIQIRTFEMHRTNEYGMAAHWRYKEGVASNDKHDTSVPWLEQLMEEKQDMEDPREFMEALRGDLFHDEVFVFTPRGDLKQLPRGSTAIDFAYAIHSEVGSKTVGAKVNGHIVPLHHELLSGCTVDIITSPSGHPSVGWLQLAKTPRARSKIRHWIKAQRSQESISLGREMLERELKQRKIKFDLDKSLVDIAQAIGYEDATRLLEAIGSGTQSLRATLNKIEPPKPKSRLANLLPTKRMQDLVRRPSSGGIRVHGIGNLMVRFANCCAPVPGDRIIGLVTRGRGISVHRQDCINVVSELADSERRIEVSWDAEGVQSFVARIIVTGNDRKDLLADISKKVSTTGTNIQSGDFSSENGVVRVSFLIEVRNLKQLKEVIRAVRGLKEVHNVRRDEAF